MIEWLVFGVVFVVALGFAIAMVFTPNAVHVALFLVGVQIALAVAFLLQGAFFVGAVQVIVYAGAIMVLFLFVIMLLGVDKREALVEKLPGQRGMAIGLGLLLAVLILYVAWRGIDLFQGAEAGSASIERTNREPGNVIAIARALFSRYLVPFEATSVLLVAAIVGVMVLARRIGGTGATVRDRLDDEESEAA